MSEWTKKLSRAQLEVIRKDTIAREKEYSSQPQDHIHKDIAAELKERDSRRK